jgi:hypothetical protein
MNHSRGVYAWAPWQLEELVYVTISTVKGRSYLVSNEHDTLALTEAAAK